MRASQDIHAKSTNSRSLLGTDVMAQFQGQMSSEVKAAGGDPGEEYLQNPEVTTRSRALILLVLMLKPIVDGSDVGAGTVLPIF